MQKFYFYEWIAKCCTELGWSIEEGAKIIKDPNWFGCFDDGMSPTEAVNEAINKGVVEHKP